MPPARRRGAYKAKANGHLRLGDLVLAKVRGFPSWPAKISRPEEWEMVPDPKKYFVKFFGIKEIAFVAPADIQVFTSECKTKLSSRLQGKTRIFTQAAKEICEAFDEIQKQKASGNDTDDSRIDSEAPPVDEPVSNPKDTTDAVTSHAEKDNIYAGNVGSNLEDSLLQTKERVSLNEKLIESGCPNESSFVSSPLIKSKLSTCSDIKTSSKFTLKVASNVNDFGQHDNENSIFANGSKPRKLVTGSKRRREVEDGINKNGGSSTGTLLIVGKSTGSADLFRPGEEIFKSRASAVKLNSPATFKPDSNGSTGEKVKNLISKNGSTGSADLFRPGEEIFKSRASAVKLNSPGTSKPDSNGSTGEKGKNLISKKVNLEVKNELQEADGKTSSIGNNNQVHAKHNVVASESLHATKKLKRMDKSHDFSSSTSGNQIVQMAGNSFSGGHTNVVVKNELFPQPSAFTLAAGCSSQEPSGFNPSRQLEYGHNDVYLNAQVHQPNQQYQQGNTPYAQRHAHPAPPQKPSNQFSYPNHPVQQHLPHAFHPPFPLPSLPYGPRQFVADEQWRMSSTNNQHQNGVWRGINPSCPGPPFWQEGFRPQLERPPLSNVGFQRAISSTLPSGPVSLSGHGAPQMLPCRPDISAVNSWRPT